MVRPCILITAGFILLTCQFGHVTVGMPRDSRCFDRIDKCHSYDGDVCNEFRTWAESNCNKFCHFCGIPQNCKDKLSNCADYPDVCAPLYEDFALENCPHFCSRCR